MRRCKSLDAYFITICFSDIPMVPKMPGILVTVQFVTVSVQSIVSWTLNCFVESWSLNVSHTCRCYILSIHLRYLSIMSDDRLLAPLCREHATNTVHYS